MGKSYSVEDLFLWNSREERREKTQKATEKVVKDIVTKLVNQQAAERGSNRLYQTKTPSVFGVRQQLKRTFGEAMRGVGNTVLGVLLEEMEEREFLQEKRDLFKRYKYDYR